MSESRFEFIPGKNDQPNSEALFDLVFVHGLTGDWKGTWTNNTDGFWPSWLASDFAEVDVYSAGYDSAFFGDLLKGDGATLADRATVLLDAITSRAHPDRPIIFVTHSLGGLVVKQLLRRSNDASDHRKKAVCGLTKAVIFMATPHLGANLANSVNLILGLLTTKSVKELKHGSENLIDLASWFSTWGNSCQLSVASYYELDKCKGALVVDKMTANPNVHGCDPTGVQADHISITKPSGRNAPVYKSVCAFVRDLLKRNAPPAAGGLDPDIEHDFHAYQATSADRRTLAQKLTSAGRVAEVERAEASKERFSKTLHRHAAQVSAVTKYARLMSNVETRFNRHITPAITRNDDLCAVNSIVQREVIDPTVASHRLAGEEVTTKLAEDAMYYLTGNCHIRWDK